MDARILTEGLTTRSSHPIEWCEVLHPDVGSWTINTNFKAIILLSNAEQHKQKYADIKNFTVAEIKQHLALYVFNGLLPSPQVEMKLQRNAKNVVNGNDFIFNSFGQHRHFKAFFSLLAPTAQPPRV